MCTTVQQQLTYRMYSVAIDILMSLDYIGALSKDSPAEYPGNIFFTHLVQIKDWLGGGLSLATWEASQQHTV